MTSTPKQLALGVSLNDDSTFHNYLVSPENQQLVDYLHALANSSSSEKFLYLWGGAASGRSHLLQAMCHEYTEAKQSALYLPMDDLEDLSPSILQGANSLSLVCLDDIDKVAGNREWEIALFHAFNEIRESATCLVVSANSAPLGLAIELADLASRLQSGLVFQLAELSDTDKRLALQLQAKSRGINLNDAVADFIILRADRSLDSLLEILDKLDESSLNEQRKLSIPLVKSTLGW